MITKHGVVYCLHSTTHPNRTYIGATKNLKRRLRQHNQEIKGGAKYTRIGKPWIVAWYITGSPSWNKTLSCEWYVKYYSRKQYGNSHEKRLKARHVVMERFGLDVVELL